MLQPGSQAEGLYCNVVSATVVDITVGNPGIRRWGIPSMRYCTHEIG